MDTNLICLCFRFCALCALSGVSPAFTPPQWPTLVMLADKNTKNACLLCDHSDNTARGDPTQDTLVRTPLWLKMMKAFPSGNGLPNPKLADRNASGCHHPMVTSLHNQSKVIIQPMNDGNGERTFKLGPIVTMSCHPWDSNAETLVPCMPCEQTLGQPTPGPSGTQWLKDLFRGKKKAITFPILTLDSSELTLPLYVKASQYNEPPIPGPSPYSKPHEDVSACEPEPEVAPTQSLEEPFG
ncbi:hypothetical protein O181_074262 [Austropuccinia psidii MF-1]|uniref:Uncharacterized protein n=1 Tax=Austropuccinia psidii MF-1 TaxID=1389203 RepID=A0A9Q3FAK8_9BASI|nr:hypothetical protein [Austropuccinia psidii MF-1]